MKEVNVDKNGLMSVMDEVSDLVVRKNHDYSNAWQKFGIFTPLIRINDKILRVKTLATGQQALVADEKIEDTLKDIIGYAALALMWLRLNGPVSLEDVLPMTIEEKAEEIAMAVLHENDD